MRQANAARTRSKKVKPNAIRWGFCCCVRRLRPTHFESNGDKTDGELKSKKEEKNRVQTTMGPYLCRHVVCIAYHTLAGSALALFDKARTHTCGCDEGVRD